MEKIILLTRHQGNVENTLLKYRTLGLFDKIIHIDKKEKIILHKLEKCSFYR